MDSFQLTARQALAKFADGSLTVTAYANSLLSRIHERDCDVKAWAYFDPEYVLEQAKVLDQIPVSQRGPLHGVSVGVKDALLTKDMPTQHGSPIYEGDAPQIDAGIVAILKKAGALLVGKTTTTEFTSMHGHPKTCNPHDLTRTPGGSSSGSAAAVADFQVAIAIGTQTGGSIIRPASFNGIYAIKPTWNALTREGAKVYSLTLDTPGFFARSIDDLDLLAEVFALVDDATPTPSFTVRGAKIAVLRSVVWPKAGPGTIATMERATQILKNNGAVIEAIDLPSEFDSLPRWHMAVLESEGRTAFLPEYRIGKENLHDALVGHVENKTSISRADQLEAYDSIAALRPKMDAIAKRYDAVLTPSAVDVAPKGHDSTGSAVFNTMWTALHSPVINVPGFTGENGLPVGISLVGARYHDRHLLKVARSVGEIFTSQGVWKLKVHVHEK